MVFRPERSYSPGSTQSTTFSFWVETQECNTLAVGVHGSAEALSVSCCPILFKFRIPPASHAVHVFQITELIVAI